MISQAIKAAGKGAGSVVNDISGAMLDGVKTSAVQKCLAKNYAKLQSAECKDEVMHNMRIRLKSFQMNDEMNKACAEDQKKFCGAIEGGGGRLMICIREHYKLLSDKCKESTTNVVDKLEALQDEHAASGSGIRGAGTGGGSSSISLSGPLAMAGVVSMGILLSGLIITLLGRIRRKSKGYSVVTIDKGG